MFQLTSSCAVATIVHGCGRREPEQTDQQIPEQVFNEIGTESKPFTEVVVRPEVTPIKQASDSTCWAAVWTMLVSWKHTSQVSIADAVSLLGKEWAELYKENRGLKAQTFSEDAFLRASKLKAKPPANYIPSAYVELLATHGPLWINTGNGILNHATLLTSARTFQNGRITFLFVDPKDGKIVAKSDEQFFLEFEKEAREIVNHDLQWDLRYQMFYW